MLGTSRWARPAGHVRSWAGDALGFAEVVHELASLRVLRAADPVHRHHDETDRGFREYAFRRIIMVPPRGEVGLIDRLVVAYEDRICRQVRVALRAGRPPMTDLLVTLAATQCCGDAVGFRMRHDQSSATAEYPAIERAIAVDTDPGRRRRPSPG